MAHKFNGRYSLVLSDYILGLTKDSDAAPVVSCIELPGPSLGFSDSVDSSTPIGAVFPISIYNNHHHSFSKVSLNHHYDHHTESNHNNPLASAFVYVCMKNGDFYAVGPIMPPVCAMTIQELKSMILHRFYSVGSFSSSSSSSTSSSSSSYWTSKYVEKFVESIDLPDGFNSLEDLFTSADPNLSVLCYPPQDISLPALVGPFRIHDTLHPNEALDFRVFHFHTPALISATTTKDAYSSSKGQQQQHHHQNKTLALVAILFEDHLALYYADFTVSPYWNRDKQLPTPQLIPLEYIQFCSSVDSAATATNRTTTKTSFKPTKIIADQLYSDLIYICMEDCVYRLSVLPWLTSISENVDNLVASIGTSNTTIMMGQQKSSKQKSHANTGEFILVSEKKITNFQVVCDVYDGYGYEAVLEDTTVIKESLPLRMNAFTNLNDRISSSTTITTTAAAGISTSLSLSSKPLFSSSTSSSGQPTSNTIGGSVDATAIDSSLQWSPFQPPNPVKPALVCSSKVKYGQIQEEDLEQFSNAVDIFQSYLVSLFEGMKTLSERIIKQKAYLKTLSSTVTSIPFTNDPSQRLEQCLKGFDDLMTRYQSILKGLDDRLPYMDEEFVTRVQALNKELPWFFKRVKFIRQYFKENNDWKHLESGFVDPSRYTETLKMQYDLLIETHKKLEKMKRRVVV